MVEATEVYQNNTSSYNCYAYAINRTLINGKLYYYNSIHWTYQPGDISENDKNNFDIDTNGYEISRIKCNVLKDLYAMGHTNVLIYTYNENDYNPEDEYDYYDFYQDMLNYIDFSTHELICFRVGSDDYHFMKYDYDTNSWYNKIRYDPIFKYTDNNGIPANDVPWGEGRYNSNIIYLAYNKLQIKVPQSGEIDAIITIKGGEYVNDDSNYIYCCGNESCCNPSGICECEAAIMNGGKDVVYEIVVPESGCYNICLYGGISAGFNYKIYSYNMYNGNYSILSEANNTINVNINQYFIIGENKYYLIVDYGTDNTFNVDINVSFAFHHSFTDSYESISSTEHIAYCTCGSSEAQDHILVGNRCTKCDEIHTHEYTDHFE